MNIREWIKLRMANIENPVSDYGSGEESILSRLESALASGEIQTGVEWHDAIKDPPKEDMDVLIYIPQRGIIDAKYKTDVNKFLIDVCAIYPTHWTSINLPEVKNEDLCRNPKNTKHI